MKKYRAALWGVGILAPCLSVPACDEAAECLKCSEAGPCADSGVPDSVTPDTGGVEAGTSDAGQLQGWAISGGGDAADRGHTIILDKLGNLVVAGHVRRVGHQLGLHQGPGRPQQGQRLRGRALSTAPRNWVINL